MKVAHEVWKFFIPITDEFALSMPEGSKILTAQVQGNEGQLWALVDTSRPTTPRYFHLRGTGHTVEDPNWVYISTFQMVHGKVVYHLFEELRG